eukprot:366203-Chlamydomonas_euryale.AAC.4
MRRAAPHVRREQAVSLGLGTGNSVGLAACCCLACCVLLYEGSSRGPPSAQLAAIAQQQLPRAATGARTEAGGIGCCAANADASKAVPACPGFALSPPAAIASPARTCSISLLLPNRTPFRDQPLP